MGWAVRIQFNAALAGQGITHCISNWYDGYSTLLSWYYCTPGTTLATGSFQSLHGGNITRMLFLNSFGGPCMSSPYILPAASTHIQYKNSSLFILCVFFYSVCVSPNMVRNFCVLFFLVLNATIQKEESSWRRCSHVVVDYGNRGPDCHRETQFSLLRHNVF